MKTLAQHLAEFSVVELRVIARRQGLIIEAGAREAFMAALVEHMLDAGQLSELWRELSPAQRSCLAELAANENRMPVAAFERVYGVIRRLGPGRLQQEKPWDNPTGVAEELWYTGLIARGFADTAEGLREFISIPTDLLPLLPLHDMTPDRFRFPPPQKEDFVPAGLRQEGEQLLEDVATLLIYVQNERVWLNNSGRWRDKDLRQMLQQWQKPPAHPENPLADGSRTALLFHLVDELVFVTRKGKRLALDAGRVRPWLERSRQEQLAALLQAWRGNSHWNDLCLTPGLRCEPGNWRNDPLLAREALLEMLQHADPGRWYALDDFIQAVHQQRPDFQRPDGQYDTWYIVDEKGEHLKGFEHWFDVEGRLIRAIWLGPLTWFGVVATDASGQMWQLNASALALLGQQAPESSETAPPLKIGEDFRVILPVGSRIYDRFRVARFCTWESSRPYFCYRITQRGLRRAAAAGIRPEQILEYLEKASGGAVPANVRQALTRLQASPP